MAKRPVRNQKNPHASYGIEDESVAYNPARFHKKPQPLQAQTEAQGQYISAIMSAELIFGIGPAGTGKTYCAAAYAADQLVNKRIDKIIVTRPNIEVGAGMGFLPGELEEKYAPFLAPFRDVMIERMGRGAYECALKLGNIVPEPLGFMRGKTFNNAIVILDEAQNVTPTEMKMFLTRAGKNCTVIVDGDVDQCDLNGPSGLQDAVERLCNLERVRIVEFTEDDIVRSGLVRDILKCYRK
jgi:phosphate starvation-inducible PhoH-like protein